MRLLVVEDDKDINRQLVAALEQAGYAVDAAHDGEEGWFLGDTEPYDAIVLDIGLPKKDGLSVPFHMEEVLARLRALLRRASGHSTNELTCGPVRLDTKSGRVVVSGQAVKLTSHEYRLLAYLMHHMGRIVSRTELVEHLYDQDFDRDSNTVEVFIGRLRKKLGVDVIETIRGLGYRLDPDATP